MSAVSCARTEGRAFRIFRLLSSLLSKNAKVPCLPSILEKESVLYSCTGKEATPEEPAEQEQPQNGMGGLLIFLVVGLLGGGAALYYVKFMKPKQNVKGSTDLDEFDFDEYDEDEPEEETDIADTEQEDEEE